MGRVRFFRYCFLLSALCLPLCSCRTPRQTLSTSDSLSVVVRERVQTVYDTVDAYIEPARIERLVPDTLSVIVTDFARSEAEVHGGLLRHTLETTGKAKAVAPVRVVTRDSIVYQDRYICKEAAPAKTPWWKWVWRLSPLALLLVIYWLARRVRHYRDRCV
ncbi:MAG: hypothetical protein LUI09_06100 [Prevotellaceae bacterium]|nr:hypothetical protein [Prevotellaceae bacterium]